MEAGGDAERLSEHASRQDLSVHELAEVSRLEILRSIKAMHDMNASASHLDSDAEKDGDDTDWRRRTVVPLPKEEDQMRWAALSTDLYRCCSDPQGAGLVPFRCLNSFCMARCARCSCPDPEHGGISPVGAYETQFT
jgi:hypothetical protein